MIQPKSWREFNLRSLVTSNVSQILLGFTGLDRQRIIGYRNAPVNHRQIYCLVSLIGLSLPLAVYPVGYRKTAACKRYFTVVAKVIKRDWRDKPLEVQNRVLRLLWIRKQTELYTEAADRAEVLSTRSQEHERREGEEALGDLGPGASRAYARREANYDLLAAFDLLEVVAKPSVESGDMLALGDFIPRGQKLDVQRAQALNKVLGLQALLMKFREVYFTYLVENMPLSREIGKPNTVEFSYGVVAFNMSRPPVPKKYCNTIDHVLGQVPHAVRLCRQMTSDPTQYPKQFVSFCSDYQEFLIFLEKRNEELPRLARTEKRVVDPNNEDDYGLLLDTVRSTQEYLRLFK